MMAMATPAPSLIPVLVTGIQPAQVLGLEGLSRRADARRLDSCDILGLVPGNRNEDGLSFLHTDSDCEGEA